MIVFMLTKYNGQDYYQKDTEFLGVYSTREKAFVAMEKDRKGYAKKYQAPFWDDLTEDEKRWSELYYQIEEIQVDAEEGQVAK